MIGVSYSSKVGNFIIKFPGKPEIDSTLQKTESYGMINTHSMIYEAKDKSKEANVFYAIFYDELPEITNSDSIQSLFDEEVANLKKNRGVVIYDSPLKFGDYPGREVHMEFKENKNILQINISL